MPFTQDTLDESEWDVLIVGTGIQQSLLALALSRSGKKILHVDKKSYYGGSEAAFTLQEAEEWVTDINHRKPSLYFSDASISRLDREDASAEGPRLARASAYAIALAPQLVYNQSNLISHLISSKADRRMEFLAMGSWWVYSTDGGPANGASEVEVRGRRLLRIPTNREAVAFSSAEIDIRAKRVLMRILRFVMEFEAQSEIWVPYASRPLSDFLTHHFNLPHHLHNFFLALTVTPYPPHKTSTGFSLPRIALHLRSIGRFGRGFSSIIPKYGGLSEIIQVACRACAVGEGVYVLEKGLLDANPCLAQPDDSLTAVVLDGNETVRAAWIAGTEDDFATSWPPDTKMPTLSQTSQTSWKSVSIILSKPKLLFPHDLEGLYAPAGSMVVFPSGTLPPPKGFKEAEKELPPVYVIVHTAETEECPSGQSVLYASTRMSGQHGKSYLESAISSLLEMFAMGSSSPQVLWTMQYQQHEFLNQAQRQSSEAVAEDSQNRNSRIVTFPSPSSDLIFDDRVFDSIKNAWLKIMGDDVDEKQFLVFEDREAEVAEAVEDGDDVQ